MASYVMNACNFTKKQLDEQDKIKRQELKKEKMHMSIKHRNRIVKVSKMFIRLTVLTSYAQ